MITIYIDYWLDGAYVGSRLILLCSILLSLFWELF